MPTTALVGGSLVAGGLGYLGSQEAADAQSDASAAAVAEQRRQFDTILGLTSPQRQVGNAALNVLAQAFIPGFQGITPGTTTAVNPGYGSQPVGQSVNPVLNPLPSGFAGGNTYGSQGTQFDQVNDLYGTLAFQQDGGRIPGSETFADNTANPYGDQQYIQVPVEGGSNYVPQNALTSASLSEQFRNLPGSQFMVDEAVNAIGNSFAARGGANSGNALRAIADRTSNMAANTIFNGLGQLAGIGNIGTDTAANAAVNQGNNVSNLLVGQGNARASGIAGSYQSANNAIQGGLQNYLLYRRTG